MDWRDEGMVLTARKHGETSVIIDVFTSEHGRHAGLVRGGVSRKLRPALQPGAQVAVEWAARLEEHLGTFRVEPVRSRAALVLGDRQSLEALNAMTALAATCLPEREPMGAFYAASQTMADGIGAEGWLRDYVRWEIRLLGEMGFALDLGSCAATGGGDDLIYVSPRTGRAVSRDGAGEWADKLLALPAFVVDPAVSAQPQEISSGLKLTGHFLRHHVTGGLGNRDLPDARMRLLQVVERAERWSG